MARISITKDMRNAAIRKAFKAKFDPIIAIATMKLMKKVRELVLAQPLNVEAINMVKGVSQKVRNIVRVESSVYLYADKTQTAPIHIKFAPEYEILKKSPSDYNDWQPYGTNCTSAQRVSLPDSYPLATTSLVMLTTDGKQPVWLTKWLEERKATLRLMDAFVEDVYHAMYSIKNLDKLRELLPAMEQYLDIPELQFTKMIPSEKLNRINDWVK